MYSYLWVLIEPVHTAAEVYNDVFSDQCVWFLIPIIHAFLFLLFNLCVLEFWNTIYIFIPQSFAVLSDKLEPLVEGVRQNKQHWLEIAGMQNHNSKMEDGGELWLPTSLSLKHNNLLRKVKKNF